MSDYMLSVLPRTGSGEAEGKRHDYGSEMTAYFETLFPGRKRTIYKDRTLLPVAVDVAVLHPTADEPFYLLYTIGMSSLSMADYLGGKEGDTALAELYMMLSEDWCLPASAALFSTEKKPWPVRLLTDLSQFSHLNKMWLSYGFMLPAEESRETFSDAGEFSGAVIIQFDGELGEIKTADGNIIQLYMPMPLYAEEKELYGTVGPDELTERILRCNGGSFLVNPERPNAAAAPQTEGRRETVDENT